MITLISLLLSTPLCNVILQFLFTMFPHPLNLGLAQFMPKPMGCSRNDAVLIVNVHLLSWPPELSC